MARYPGLTLRVLGARSAAMGPGRAALLEKIARSGSISAAAREMGMSYRRAWQLVDSINSSFKQPVIETAIGGRRGGGTRITGFGQEVLARYRSMEGRASAAIESDIERFCGLLKAPAARARRR
ncbi:MAG: LysR family transcriptional regulator [Burkholderiales bacterium]|nr:LysR family transcriptional regulator [Burkholderiales bacterium]